MCIRARIMRVRGKGGEGRGASQERGGLFGGGLGFVVLHAFGRVGLFRGLRAYGTGSYTHLDVYKRQLTYMTLPRSVPAGAAMAEGKAASRAARRERGSLVFIKGSRGCLLYTSRCV